MKRVCCLLLAAVLLVGCTPAQPAQTEPYTLQENYTEAVIMEIEPLGTGRLFSRNVWQTESDGNTYQFHKDISLETRADFIDKQRQLNELLAELAGWQVSGVFFRMHTEYPCRSDSQEQAVYLDPSIIGSWQQALVTIQCVLGDDVNYGYAWAMANDLAAWLGWTVDDDRAENAGVFEKEPEMLNLVYPCFHEDYSSNKEIRAAKALAAALYAEMEEPYAGAEGFLAQAQRYAEANGIDFTPTYLRFSYQGGSCPLQIGTRYLTYQMDSTFREDAYRMYMSRNWVGTIGDMVQELENMDTMLEGYREMFGFQGDAVLPVRMTSYLAGAYEGEIHEYAGFYTYDQKMSAISITVILHEYVHYLYHMCAADWRSGESWHTEALAYYLSEADQARMMGDDAEIGPFIERMHRYIVSQLDETKPKWWISTNNVHSEVLSIAGYLVDTYGEDVFVQLMLDPSQAEELTGRTIDQIENDWAEFIYNYDQS